MTDVPAAPEVDTIVERVKSGTGVRLRPTAVTFEWREWRWMAVLPEVVLLVAAGEEGWRRLRREGALVRAARAVVGEPIPAVLLEDADRRLQVREARHGLHGHAIESRIFGVAPDDRLGSVARFAPDCPLTAWGERFAEDQGRTFARFHRAMKAEAGRAAGFGPCPTDWGKIERVLHALAGVDHLLRALPAARDWDEARPIEEVVLHGDPHLYNMFAAEDGALSGLVDFGDAAIGDRHEDLRYVHSDGPRFARLAVDAYADEAGVALDHDLVARLHVRSAFGHFEWWDLMVAAGRTRAIIAWTSEALTSLAPDWVR